MEHNIDPVRLANQSKTLQGEVALSRCRRLETVLSDMTGSVSYELDFSRSDQGKPVVNGRITANVMLECQRCGGTVEVALELNPHLMIVITDEQAKQVPSDYEPLLVDEAPLTIVDVLEEEILLGLPMVPRHDEGQCPASMPEYLN